MTNVTSGGSLGRILRNSSGHVTGHETRHFWSRDFLSRDFRLLYLAPHLQIWLELSPYTTLLGELSVESQSTGIVPSDWRTALVSPVYKKGKKYNPENYRPISLTCFCCKLLEHLIAKHILSHADTHTILYPLQHGFALVDFAKLNSWNLSMMSLLAWKMENKQISWSRIFQKLLTRSHTLFFYINYTIMTYRAN